jgi:hypothetical protein
MIHEIIQGFRVPSKKTPKELQDCILPYLSIDLETLGLNPYAPVIQAAVVVEYSRKIPVEDLPCFEVNLTHKTETLHNCEFYAMNMNREIIKDISENGGMSAKDFFLLLEEAFVLTREKTDEFIEHLKGIIDEAPESSDAFAATFMLKEMPKKKKVLVAGKNIMKADIPWLHHYFNMEGLGESWKGIEDNFLWHRTLDAGSAFYSRFGIVPSLGGCKTLMNISGEVSHTALEDARDVVRVMRELSVKQ